MQIIRNRFLVASAVLALAACASPRNIAPTQSPTPAPEPVKVLAPVAVAPVVVTPPRAPVVVAPPVALPPTPLPIPPSIPAVNNRGGLSGKLMVGYQGWFGCPGDFENNASWRHWFLANDSVDCLTVDQIPSVRGIADADLCITRMKRPDGTPVKLFSSQNPRVVAQHFRWMQQHQIDGAAVQRFTVELADPASRRRMDNVLRNVRAAAEASGRLFYLTFDISGANADTVEADVRNDWRHVVNNLGITQSPNYLHDRGKPMLQLWGFGFEGRPGSPDRVQALMNDLKAGRDGLAAVALIGGVPTNWRTLDRDAKSDPAWARVYRSFDVISPWSVGRFADDRGADNFVRSYVIPDLAETKRLGIGYMPVMFPGFSWHNLMKQRGQKAAAVNQVPRRCGNFLWQQASALMGVGVESIYAAMFDEVDEGTSLFPTETTTAGVPANSSMVTLNQDGCVLPEDWYLQVTGKAAQHLKRRQMPSRDLGRVMRE